MIIKVLMDDITQNPAYAAEHGLSLYLEANGKKILFDTGQSAAFAKNAETLGVDLSQVDFAVLSHAHYDHSGGLQTFLSLNDSAPVYVSPYTFDEYLHGENRFIGVDPVLKKEPRIAYVKDKHTLADGITLYSSEGFTPSQPVQSYGLTVRRGGEIAPDDFRHEQYLEIVENGKRVLISGCSHKGIINIVQWFAPDILVGGFHLIKLDPKGDGKEALDTVSKNLLKADTAYYTCHCTGFPQYEYLKRQMRDTLFYISSGQEIVI